jgi:hypothetical protein
MEPAAVEAEASRSPADEAYLVALASWKAGDWTAAREGAAAALAIDAQHGPARLLEGFALIRDGRMRDGVEILDAISRDEALLERDPEVSMLAVHVLRRYADRWRRDQWSLSAGPIWREGSASRALPGVHAVAGELWLPFSHRLGARFGVTTPLSADDALSITGPIFDAVLAWQQPIGTGVWHADVGLGPSIWTGRSDYWDGRFRGVFPGGRAAVALDVRPTQNLGFRLEAGVTSFYGARQQLDFWSTAFDVRLLATGYPR